MSKYMHPVDDVYRPGKSEEHRWAELFKDIPLKWEQVPGGSGLIYRPGGAGVLAMPHTAAALARHVELCGFVHDADAQRVRRVDPVRSGRSLTAPGIWQDITEEVPDEDPAAEVAAAAVRGGLTPQELRRAAAALIDQAEQSAG